MTSLLSVAVALLIAAVLVCVFTLLKFKSKNGILSKVLKPFAVVLFVTAFLRHTYLQTAIYYVAGLDHPSSPFNVDGPNPGLTAFAIILVWLSYAAMLTTVLSIFFNFKTLRRIVNLFSLPVVGLYFSISAFKRSYSCSDAKPTSIQSLHFSSMVKPCG